jgi:hypothetical protein
MCRKQSHNPDSDCGWDFYAAVDEDFLAPPLREDLFLCFRSIVPSLKTLLPLPQLCSSPLYIIISHITHFSTSYSLTVLVIVLCLYTEHQFHTFHEYLYYRELSGNFPVICLSSMNTRCTSTPSRALRYCHYILSCSKEHQATCNRELRPAPVVQFIGLAAMEELDRRDHEDPWPPIDFV